MNKRKLHHLWVSLRVIKPWRLLVVAALCGVVCLFALRANNLHMIKLREAVYMADKDNGDVRGALNNLQGYVFAHMNTNLTSGQNAVHPPIQLKYTYDRLVKAQAGGAADQNGDIYTQAQAYCEAAIPNGFSGSYRLSCIQTYVKQHGITSAQTVPKNLYQFDFASPRWSPDLAGWSLVATVFFAILAAGLGLFRHVIRRFLRT